MRYEMLDVIKASGSGCESLLEACMCSRGSGTCCMQLGDTFGNLTITRDTIIASKGQFLRKEIIIYGILYTVRYKTIPS